MENDGEGQLDWQCEKEDVTKRPNTNKDRLTVKLQRQMHWRIRRSSKYTGYYLDRSIGHTKTHIKQTRSRDQELSAFTIRNSAYTEKLKKRGFTSRATICGSGKYIYIQV
jgi:hypothetical protein